MWAKGSTNVGFRGTNYIYPNAIGSDAVAEMYNYVVKKTPFPANTYVSPVPMTQSNHATVDKSCG